MNNSAIISEAFNKLKKMPRMRDSKKSLRESQNRDRNDYKSYILNSLKDSRYSNWANVYSDYDFIGVQPWVDGSYNVTIDDDAMEIRIPVSMSIEKIVKALTSKGRANKYKESYRKRLKEGFVKLNDEPIEIDYIETDDVGYVPMFKWDGKRYNLNDFIRCHNNPWGEIDCPDYIHAYDSSQSYNPIFIGLDDSGEYLDVYEQSEMDESYGRRLKEGISKKEFVNAYIDSYGGTVKDASKQFLKWDESSKKELVNGFKNNSKKSFLTDSLKEAKASARKKVTQKYLKNLISKGQAENLNTWSDEDLDALDRNHHLETIAVSYGIYGMNGILLQDENGELYAVPSRSSTMFRMHRF